MRRIALLALASLVLPAGDLNLLRSSLSVLRKGGVPAARDAQPGSPADRVVVTLPQTEEQVPWRARFMAAEWLLLAHLERLRMQPVPVVAQERRDLELAWTLIQNALERSQSVVVGTKGLDTYRGENATQRVAGTKTLSDSVGVEDVPEALRTAMVSLALEISVRRMDPEAMSKSVAYALKLGSLLPRDKAFALMSALHGGAWTDAIRWARDLEGAKVLGAFHQAALANPESFDYSALAALSAPKAAAAPVTAGTERREVKDLRLRLRTTRGAESQGKALQAAFGTGWQSTGPLATPFLRLGAAAHWQKPGQRPIPLTGAATAEGFDLCGYVDLPAGGRRTEALFLTRDPARPGTWIGRLLAEQPTGEGPLVAEFEAELDLGPPTR